MRRFGFRPGQCNKIWQQEYHHIDHKARVFAPKQVPMSEKRMFSSEEAHKRFMKMPLAWWAFPGPKSRLSNMEHVSVIHVLEKDLKRLPADPAGLLALFGMESVLVRIIDIMGKTENPRTSCPTFWFVLFQLFILSALLLPSMSAWLSAQPRLMLWPSCRATLSLQYIFCTSVF